MVFAKLSFDSNERFLAKTTDHAGDDQVRAHAVRTAVCISRSHPRGEWHPDLVADLVDNGCDGRRTLGGDDL